MKGDRANKVVATDYHEGFYEIVQMSDGNWSVFDDNIDLGKDFETLNEARAWCKAHPANPDFAQSL